MTAGELRTRWAAGRAARALGRATMVAVLSLHWTSPSSAQDLRVLVSVDLEGIAGLVSSSQMSVGGHDYGLGRVLAEAETNAAVETAFEVGAGHVLVVDSHGGKTNLRPDRLDARAELLTGGPRPLGMIHGIDSAFDAVIFVGFHARASTTDAVHDHTYTGQLKRIAFNGAELGEAGLAAAAVAGHFGTPSRG